MNVNGYHLSPKNVSTDLLTGFRLLGVVREDIEGMNLLFEPGQQPNRQPNFDAKTIEEHQWRRTLRRNP